MRNRIRGLSSRSKIGTIVTVAIVITVTVAMMPASFPIRLDFENYPMVTVTGRVKTLAAYPERIEFRDSAGEKFSATVII